MNKDHKIERSRLIMHVTSNTPINTLKNKINISQLTQSSSQLSISSQSQSNNNISSDMNIDNINIIQKSNKQILPTQPTKAVEAPLKKRTNSDRTPLKDKINSYEDSSPLALGNNSINPFKVPTNLNMNKNKKIAKSNENINDNLLMSQPQSKNDMFSMSQPLKTNKNDIFMSQSQPIKSKLFDSSSQMSMNGTQDFIKSKIGLSQSQRGILLSPNDEFVKLMTQSQSFCTPMDQAIQPRGLDMLKEDMVVSKHEHKQSLSSKLVRTAEVDRLAQNLDSCSMNSQQSKQKSVANFNYFFGDISRQVDSKARDSYAPTRFYQEFEIINSIGKGSFGEVYQCRNKVDGCVYAIKKLTKKAISVAIRNNQLNEVFAMSYLSQAQCPSSILRYYGSWMEDEYLYLQSELCPQGNLESQLKKCGPFTQEKLVKVCYDVSKALEFMHSINLAHLDVKPENILENCKRYLLADFGLVQPMTGENSPAVKGDLTTGDSRELIEEKTDNLDKGDVFALGLTIYVLAGGNLVSHGPQAAQIRYGNITPLQNFNESNYLFNLVKAMMSHNILLRPSAKEIVILLDKEYKLSTEQIEIQNLKIEMEQLKLELQKEKEERSILQKYLDM